MIYEVKYFDKGEKRTTTESNTSKEEIISNYTNKGYQIITIKEKSKTSFLSNNKKLRDKDLHILFMSLNVLLSSGMSLKESLEILSTDTELKYSKTIASISNDISNGYLLSEAFKNTRCFPETVVKIIFAGEKSNTLEESTYLLANFYNSEHKLKQSVKNALYYPAILLTVTLFIVLVVINYILPNYIDLYKSYGVNDLPQLTTTLISFSNFISNNLLILTGFVFLIIWGLVKLLKISRFRYIFHKYLIRLPLLGKYLLFLDLQRFSAVLSLMDKSGINLLDSVYTSSSTIKNFYLYSHFIKIKDEIALGNTLYNSISNIELIPSIFVNLVRIGEESASIHITMNQAYEYLNEQNKEYSKLIISMFEPTIILLLGLIVGTIVIAIALPSFNIINVI